MTRTLLIDNYDSFTFNLYQLLAQVNGTPPAVIRNDQVRFEALDFDAYDNIVLSPGPGTPACPADIGVCLDVLAHAPLPVLGVCLGHQALGLAFGARITCAPEAMHGRPSPILHTGTELFAGLTQGFIAMRYHSLMVATPLPDALMPIAWTEDGIIMGLRHRERPLWGVQFHPESIGTEPAAGRRLLENFRHLSHQAARNAPHAAIAPPRAAAGFQSIVPQAMPAPRTSPRWTLQHRRLPWMPDAEAAFGALFAALPYGFWLDSSRSDACDGRFSYLGGTETPSWLVTYCCPTGQIHVRDPHGEHTTTGDVLTYLRSFLAEQALDASPLPFDFNSGLVGYFGYELKADCGASARHRSPYPDAAWWLADRMLVIDHMEQVTYLLYLTQASDPTGQETAAAWFEHIERTLAALPCRPPPLSPGAHDTSPLELMLERSEAQYHRDIAQCRAWIHEGQSYELCLTQQLRAEVSIDPWTYYRTLRRCNPSPRAAYLRLGELAIVSSSPERFLRIDRSRMAEAKPIKGTLPRGPTPAQDQALAQALRDDPKIRSEHLMIVDLLRNDLGAVCEIGSVHVSHLMTVESYATLHQLVSTVRGQLRAGLSAIDCVRAAFPGGSMTGAPKQRTMALLDTLETQARGIYSGALGFFGLNGTVDLSMVIRTAVLTPGQLSIGIGGAIVALSDAAAEFDETLLKAQALIEAAVRTLAGEPARPARELPMVLVGGRPARPWPWAGPGGPAPGDDSPPHPPIPSGHPQEAIAYGA